MKLSRLQTSSLQVCFIVVIATIILVVTPTHSNVVVTRDMINRLCGDDRLYFKKTKKCYPAADEQGPCGALNKLVPSVENKNIGECKCVSWPLCPQRPSVFWEEDSRCYYIYDQGPCKTGNWLVPHKDGSPTCEGIPCPEKYNEAKIISESGGYIFPHQGKCYEAESKGTIFCPPEQYVYFRFDDGLNLRCKQYHVACGVSFPPATKCPDGSDPDFQGGCEPTAQI